MDFEGCGKGGETAVRARNHILAPHCLGESHDPFSHQFRMLNENRTLRDDAWNDRFPFRQLDRLPEPPFMFVAWIRRLERISARSHAQNDIDNVPQLHVVDPRTKVDAVAGMISDLLFGDTSERMIERLDPHISTLAA